MYLQAAPEDRSIASLIYSKSGYQLGASRPKNSVNAFSGKTAELGHERARARQEERLAEWMHVQIEEVSWAAQRPQEDCRETYHGGRKACTGGSEMTGTCTQDV